MISLMWLLIIASWVIAFIGAVLPIIPGVLFMILGYFIYGWFQGFEALGTVFWLIQGFCAVTLIGLDYWLSAVMIKRFGGSKASMIGGTIGLLLGPWLQIGMIIGTFIGTFVSEYGVKKDWRQALRVGWGAVLSFLIGAVLKVLIQIVMIIQFMWTIN